MAENTNLKGFTSNLRGIIDKKLNIVQKDYQNLIKKFEMTPEDLDKIDALSSKYLTGAREKLDYGSWREAEDLAVEALYISPFNREALEFYLNLMISKEKELGAKRSEEYSIYLERLAKVDKALYKKFLSIDREKVKVSPLWLLTLLLIPLIVVAIKLEVKEPGIVTKSEKVYDLNPVGLRDIEVEYIPNLNFTIDFKASESILEGFEDRYSYTLKGNFISREDNITYIRGDITWLDIYGAPLFKESFNIPKGAEYYPEEEIPLFYLKTSKRVAPEAVKVTLFITEVLSSKGLKRSEEKKLLTRYGGREYEKISINLLDSKVTEGVVSNYLSYTLKVENLLDKGIGYLDIDLIWYDFYKVEQFRKEIILLDSSDIELEPYSSKIIPLIIEVDSLYNDLEIEIVGLNERTR